MKGRLSVSTAYHSIHGSICVIFLTEADFLDLKVADIAISSS